MPRLIDKYSKFEATNNIGYAVILLDGYLKNMVSEEKRRELLAKLAIPALVESGSTDAVKALYGNRFDVPLSMAMEIALKENDKSSEMFGKGLWAQGDIGKYFNSPEMEDVFAEFNDGMQELLEILDANEDKMDFSDPNSMNSYRFMKGILKNSYEGTFSERIEEDPDYGAAVALTAKVGFETAGFAYSKKTGQVNIVKSGESNQKVLQGTRDTGIIEFMAGGTRVNEKIRENITTGNTSRQELLYEFDEQTKRLGKLMELTDEQTDRLRDMNILQNARDEFTNGNRGISFASYDMQARRDALNAGYPVEDLAAMSAFYIQKELFQRSIDVKQKAYDNSVKKNPIVEGPEKEERDRQKAELDQLKGFCHDMTNVWQDVIDSKKGPLTQEKRVANLRKLKASAEKVTKKISPVPAGLINYSKRMEERENARLSTGDKALLAGNYTEMYNALNEADPRTLLLPPSSSAS